MISKLLERKLNNKGSALLTVILLVAFLTVLATTLLYVSGTNMQIKQADYQNKKSFYSGEEALEEIRANLMEDASKAALLAYNEVMMNYDALRDGDYRRAVYYDAFVTELQEVWVSTDPLAPGVDDWRQILNDRFSGRAYPAVYTLSLPLGFTSADVLELKPDEGYVRIKGIQMIYYDDEIKRTTIITTDFDVHAPEIDWYANESKKTLPGTEAEDIERAAARNSKTIVDVSKCVKYANWKKE